jgi:hypothetical protein
MIGYEEKLDRVLDRMGGVYHWRDIKERLEDGRMQSFAHGNSMLITQINVYPRARALDWLAAVGDMEDWRPIHDAAIDFAGRHDVSLIRAHGRRGWAPFIRDHGWRTLTVNQVYQKGL